MAYPQAAFREERVDVLHQAIRQTGFGTLLTHPDGEFALSHLPLELDDHPAPKGILLGHVARSNPQWRAVGEGIPALAVLLGPNGYISPSLYPSKREDPRQAPTWNYVAVHAYGTLRTFDDPDRLLDLLNRLTRRNESGRDEPWEVSDAPVEYVHELLRYIVGLELTIERLEGRYKLSQNRSATDQDGVRMGLASGNEHQKRLAEVVADAQVRDGNS